MSSPTSTRVKPPGSVAVAIVVSMMFVTPVLAATTLHPLKIRWGVLLDFVSAHQGALILGFSLMLVIALMLRAAETPARPRADVAPALRDAAPHGLDGLA
jgi:hypothetical protein